MSGVISDRKYNNPSSQWFEGRSNSNAARECSLTGISKNGSAAQHINATVVQGHGSNKG